MPKLNVSCSVSAAAKAGAAAILALGLFASSPYTNQARAIDISGTPNAVNASLVFSPAFIRAGAGAVQTCARNYSTSDVGVLFVIQRLDQNNTIVHADATTIPPNSRSCDQPSVVELNGISTDYTSQIFFTSPAQCSQATEYPGKCRVTASWEIFDDGDETRPPSRLHTEPVLLPGIPGNPRINPVLPQ
jgi:hypothetical protein